MRIALIVPHIFMHGEILPRVIFAPGFLALSLADGLVGLGHEVTLFSPGPVKTNAKNITADLTNFEHELSLRGDDYLSLLQKHPLVFISLARQVQGEIIANAYRRANDGEFDLIHVYANEEELALTFAEFCQEPVVFTHHEPFNFLAKYRSVFPKYKNLNWLSISLSQRKSMPPDTNWVGNVYHGIDKGRFHLQDSSAKDKYVAYFGRIIEPKGVHLAIAAAKEAGVKLKIAGKHYSGQGKDSYWTKQIEPLIDGENAEYVGFLKTDAEKQEFLGNAKALLVPSTWEEPFGMVMIESLACGTPVIGLGNGAIPEIIENGKTGFVAMEDKLADSILGVDQIDRKVCRQEFENRFTSERMCQEHSLVYEKLTKKTT